MRPLMLLLAAGLSLAGMATATPALADPCKAVPDRGPTPAWLKPGQTFGGQVRYVGDGDSLCVGASADPRSWVEVRLADFNAPELAEPRGPAAKAALSRLTLGRTLACRAGRRSYDRIVARCTLNGVSVGTLLRRAGAEEGGR